MHTLHACIHISSYLPVHQPEHLSINLSINFFTYRLTKKFTWAYFLKVISLIFSAFSSSSYPSPSSSSAMDTSLLFPKTNSNAPTMINPPISNSTAATKSFTNVVSNNVCDIPLSQFPQACVKGDDRTWSERTYGPATSESCKEKGGYL